MLCAWYENLQLLIVAEVQINVAHLVRLLVRTQNCIDSWYYSASSILFSGHRGSYVGDKAAGV